MTWELQHGDCRTLMAAMDEASVDSIVTDPPYELGFMGRSWDSTGVAYDVGTWRQALRVLKPGGMLVAFGGSRTYHRMACAIEDAGFEIRDQIMWIYGSGFPKGGVQDGIGTCLKPAHEPIVLARKPLVGSARANIAAHGTGGLNIDACRIVVSADDDIHAKNPHTVNRGSNEIYGDFRQDGSCPAYDPTAGRWPANVIHDGSDEVLAGFPETCSGAGQRRPQATDARSTYSAGWPANEYARDADSGSAARFFYCAKASKVDRNEGLEHLPKRPSGMVSNTSGQHLTRRDEGYEVAQRANHHPTVKPEAVMRWLVRLATPVGGIVLDPFTGSGSTGKAAILEGRSFIGCELTAEYVPIARARIAAAVSRAAQQAADAAAAVAAVAPAPQMHLFDEERAA